MTDIDLINIAKFAKKNAYAPSTSYKVGAALLAKTGTVYIGVNIEDKIIPNLSVCAERAAFQNAISHGEREFSKIAIVGGNEEDIEATLVPCGLCLQYMLDFSKDVDIVIYIKGEIKTKKIKEFFNVPFELN